MRCNLNLGDTVIPSVAAAQAYSRSAVCLLPARGTGNPRPRPPFVTLFGVDWTSFGSTRSAPVKFCLRFTGCKVFIRLLSLCHIPLTNRSRPLTPRSCIVRARTRDKLGHPAYLLLLNLASAFSSPHSLPRRQPLLFVSPNDCRCRLFSSSSSRRRTTKPIRQPPPPTKPEHTISQSLPRCLSR